MKAPKLFTSDPIPPTSLVHARVDKSLVGSVLNGHGSVLLASFATSESLQIHLVFHIVRLLIVFSSVIRVSSRASQEFCMALEKRRSPSRRSLELRSDSTTDDVGLFGASALHIDFARIPTDVVRTPRLLSQPEHNDVFFNQKIALRIPIPPSRRSRTNQT